MKKFFSRYHPRYIRSLVYMMQASEYHVPDFLRWFWRTHDFSRVEQRKNLVYTPKAVFFLIIGYVALILLYVCALWPLFLDITDLRYLALFLAIVLVMPFVLAYGMAGLLIASRLVQIPVEHLLVTSAKRRLQAHTGFKIAVAGSYGKTTMREILKAVLSAGKKVAAPPGSHNTPLGISRFINSLKGDEEVLIFELGEYYPGDIRRLCILIQPEIGIITGVNEAHLERFKDVERTRKTIFELSDYLGGKPLYINAENELARKYTRASDTLYSRAGTGEWRVEDARTSLDGTVLALRRGSQNITAQSRLLGLHQVGPLTVAADIASKLSLTPEQIATGIEETRPFEHRLEPKPDAQGVIVLDDSYNGNPDGVRAATQFLSSLTGNRRWYVTPGLVEMGGRSEEVHKEIGHEIARAGIEKVVLVRNSVTPFIEKGLQEERYGGEVVWFDKATDAFAALPNLTVKGDVVLLQNDWPDQYA